MKDTPTHWWTHTYRCNISSASLHLYHCRVILPPFFSDELPCRHILSLRTFICWEPYWCHIWHHMLVNGPMQHKLIRSLRIWKQAQADTWLYASPGLQSTAISMRATKKCWWTGAYNPGAIIVPYFRVSPGCSAPKLRTPVSFTSASIFPSCNRQKKVDYKLLFSGWSSIKLNMSILMSERTSGELMKIRKDKQQNNEQKINSESNNADASTWSRYN